MAELRSFLVGIVIAGLVLLVAAAAFGAFGSDSDGSPSVRLLGTPPPTRTPPPAATRDPSQFTPVAPQETSQPPTEGTVGAGGTPDPENPIQTATPPPQEVVPTEAPPVVVPTDPPPVVIPTEPPPVVVPTEPPVIPTEPPPPTQDPNAGLVDAYISEANSYTPGLLGQLEYLAGIASGPQIGDTAWEGFATDSANTIQGLAGSLAALSPPGCLANAHVEMASAASLASGAAGQVVAGIQAADSGTVTAAAGGLAGARDAVNAAVASANSAVAAC